MSLKAKIEAVIYASEEPVTLAQLVGLLGEEGQAELDALASQQTSLALDEFVTPDEPAAEHEASTPEQLNAEILGEDLDADGELAPESVPADAAKPESGPASEDDDADAPAAPADKPDETAATVAPAEPADETPNEKKLAREAAAETKARERLLRDYFRELLEALIADYANGDRGLEIREVAGGFRLATKPEYHDAVRGFVKSLKPPLKLSLQALETLAVVAYKQPVTSPEVSEIRGVDSGGVLGGLMARKLVTTAGRKQVIGRPILYKTTKDFLVRFGLKDINELPSIEEFEKMAGELADADPIQEEIPMPDQTEAPSGNLAEETDEAPDSSMDELNAEPEPTTELHDTPEEMMSDKSTHPEGAAKEPELTTGDGRSASEAVEPMRDVHEAQADGVPDDPSSDFDADKGGA